MITPRELSGRYELGETIGFGGMSEVHRAHDRRLQRDVAIKVLRPDLARDPTFYLRFRREAQNAASLNNSTIVAVYDTGEAETDLGPLPYIVMEIVEGDTLRDLVRASGPMEPDYAMRVIAEVCTALEFSHTNGIIHRDVKPANIMVSHSGAVKVMDFGISRAISDATNSVTQTATVIGTAHYLSPEQARGEKVDARSDIYSLGCVLYEVATGEPPFTGDTPVSVAYQHVKEDPVQPSKVNPSVPRALDAIILKAMSKNPANRYQHAGEMRTDLLNALEGRKTSAPTIMTDAERTTIIGLSEPGMSEFIPTEDREHRQRGGWIALILLLLLAFAAVGSYFWWASETAETDMVTVPAVVSLSSADAQNQLRQLGFDVYTEAQPDVSVPEGAVIGTEPPSGAEVEAGTRITVFVSSGPGRVPVPSLVGLTIDEAEELLRDAGLELVDEIELASSSNAERDLIIRQNPSPEVSVTVGAAVRVTVGTGPDLVRVPDVTGQNEEIAVANLRASGFEVSVDQIDSDSPVNTVVEMAPTGGTQATLGTTVTLQVSNGSQMQMPNLMGSRPAEALQALRGAGWSGEGLIETRRPTLNPAEVGRIMSQQQSPGSTIGRNDPISVEVGELGIPR
ncbi:Stk1 family PASTA domain-containing Ser/Thr kinase [Hoyosella rhizosphaerae]|uniref:non-specific serine/threonine protein kinase n=1 Tax=Hoyosella rhizosphaerae TaxID=1755582 RepID=A0A916XDR2_9ACTN|nr:Stk1 family PASTA domain-containing Ser/Thr kinase [Hoyosella rhizosphaerae]MBN4927456.1 Stk1 family PASTA domain-containing Ser/Thr kinase [Hoyosella rhizosphaerae]GGC64269.1 putative serine/threonine-protein kinase PknB [Hoyosella rhizosphaerae]